MGAGPGQVDQFVADFVDAGVNERVRLMRSLPDQMGGADAAKVRNRLAKEAFAALMSSEFATIEWRPEREADLFRQVYARVAELTDGFTNVSVAHLADVLETFPQGILVFRVIVGYTTPELSDATAICLPGQRVNVGPLKTMESGGTPKKLRHAAEVCAQTINALVTGTLFPPTPDNSPIRTKQQKFDTVDGWVSVRQLAAEGVPYWAYLHLRSYGGAFRQLSDATSKSVGAVVEDQFIEVVTAAGFIHVQSAGDMPAVQTPAFIRTTSAGVDKEEVANRFGITLNLVPDFVFFHGSELKAFVECKYASDHGTAKEKAGRITVYEAECKRLGVPMFTVLAGRGFRDRPAALGDIIKLCEGRVLAPATLALLLETNPFPALLAQVP